jgi:hypothetical protein
MEWLDQNADDFAWGKAPDPDYYAFPHCPIVHARPTPRHPPNHH